MRVLFLTNIPAPYRVDFFNELGKECDLTVLYERSTASDRDNRWISDTNKNFKSIFLKSVNIRQDAGLSFDVIKFLNKKYLIKLHHDSKLFLMHLQCSSHLNFLI